MDPRWCPVCLDPLARDDECARCGNRLLPADALGAPPLARLITADANPWLSLRETPRGFVLRMAQRSWLAALAGAWVAIALLALAAQVAELVTRGRLSTPGVAVSLAMLAGFGLLFGYTAVGVQTLEVDGDEATLITRVGPLAWTERARWSSVRGVRVERIARTGGVHLDEAMSFGQALSARRQFEAARALYPRLVREGRATP